MSFPEGASTDGNARERLIRAADAEIAARGIGAIRMDAVARRAGMSRATAFRHAGSTYELLIQVALRHARRHTVAIKELVAVGDDAFVQLEAAVVYGSSQLRTDPTISALMSEHSTSAYHPKVHSSALETLGPVLRAGQRAGQIRTDLEIDELIDFLVEQVYLAAQAEDRSEKEARRRFRHFIAPGIAASNAAVGPQSRPCPEVEAAVQSTLSAVAELAKVLGSSRL